MGGTVTLRGVEPKIRLFSFVHIRSSRHEIRMKNHLQNDANTRLRDNPSRDDNSNMSNANKGSSGTNTQYDQNQGNRGKQLNPNQKPSKGGKQKWVINKQILP